MCGDFCETNHCRICMYHNLNIVSIKIQALGNFGLVIIFKLFKVFNILACTYQCIGNVSFCIKCISLKQFSAQIVRNNMEPIKNSHWRYISWWSVQSPPCKYIPVFCGLSTFVFSVCASWFYCMINVSFFVLL